MEIKERIIDVNLLVKAIIENQKDKIIKDFEFCCGMCDFNIPANIIETEKLKIIYTDKGQCEIRRKQNNNPVVCIDENQHIYRQHGEWNYLKYEMYKLAGFEEEATELLKNNFKYD